MNKKIEATRVVEAMAHTTLASRIQELHNDGFVMHGIMTVFNNPITRITHFYQTMVKYRTNTPAAYDPS